MAASRSIGSLDPHDSNLPDRPAPILLDQHSRIGDTMNLETIATGKSSDGHTMDISFWIHRPPDLSYFCVKLHKPPGSKYKDDNFEEEPHVVAAEDRFVVLRARFTTGMGEDEYFMYKIGNSLSGEAATLDLVPRPREFRLPSLTEFGIVPRCNGQHYLLVSLCLAISRYHYLLNIYSSGTEEWRRIQICNPCPEVDRVIGSKVVTLGEGLYGWVDLQHGMLVCNLHETNPSTRYIPLPDPLPENEFRLESLPPGTSARRYRDVTCNNGVIKFIELEHRVYWTAVTVECDIREKGRHHNCDLIKSRKRRDLEEKLKWQESWCGWKAVMWSQSISSDVWVKEHEFDVDDIIFENSEFSSLCGLRGNDLMKDQKFKYMYSAYPTLSTEGDSDILYLKTQAKFNDSDGQLIAIELAKKRVKALGIFSTAMHEPSIKAFDACTLLRSTNATLSSFSHGTPSESSNRQRQSHRCALVPEQPVLEPLQQPPPMQRQLMRKPVKIPCFRHF